MRDFVKYYDKLEDEFQISDYSYKEETTVFTGFIGGMLQLEKNISSEEKTNMEYFLKVPFIFLEGKLTNEELTDIRVKCWKAHDNTTGLVKRYYRMIVIFLYEGSCKDDPSSQFTPFELFLDLLEEIDETYPKKFYEYMVSKKYNR